MTMVFFNKDIVFFFIIFRRFIFILVDHNQMFGADSVVLTEQLQRST